MKSRSEQLTELADELHEVNRELAEAARPLRQLSELDFDQRQLVAAQMRAGLAHWETISQRIAQVLHDGPGSGGCADAA